MNLRSVDLNLLTLFDAIFEERQLSRAADKLGMSQSAASNALARLRLTFKDDLFIRTREGMEPTPKAQVLALHVREGLDSIRIALSDDSEFDPSKSQRTFRLLLNDFIEPVILPRLLKTIQAEGEQLALQSFSSQRPEYFDQLKKAQIDFHFGLKPTTDPQFECLKIYQETLSVLASSNHPRLGDTLSADEYLRERHIIFTNHDERTTSLDLVLEPHQSIPRKLLVQASHLSLVPDLVTHSDALATMPTQTAKRFCRTHDLQRYDFPMEIGSLPLYMIWHKSLNQDKAHQWLKGKLLSFGY